jgi:hypothetical protein
LKRPAAGPRPKRRGPKSGERVGGALLEDEEWVVRLSAGSSGEHWPGGGNIEKNSTMDEARPKLNVPNTTVHTVYSRKNMVSYSTEPYHILYCQCSAKSLDSTGAVAVLQHHTTISVQHGTQP